MRAIPRFIVVGLTLFGCVGCDQVSKSAARAFLIAGQSRSFLSDSLRFQLVENSGSFLSLGAALPAQWRFFMFTGLVALLLLGLVLAALFTEKLGPRRCVALALLAGGGIGNLIDRVLYDGRVTDFLNVGVGALRTGIFNIADIAVMAGALWLVFESGALQRRSHAA